MIKTIDITNITDEMIEVAAASAQLRAMEGVTEHTALIRGSILAALIMAPTVEPAQAVPVAWTDDDYTKIIVSADIAKAEGANIALWAAPPAIDDETKRMVLELCSAAQEHVSVWTYPYGKQTLELAKQIRERLEAGK